MTTLRLSTALGSGPSSGTAYATGDLVEGTTFQVNQGGWWLIGYEQWILPTVQSLTGFKYAAWQVIGVDAAGPSPLTGSVVSAATLTAGAWNPTLITTPILLTPGFTTATSGTTFGGAYHACVGQPSATWGAFPETKSQFGSTEPFATGITVGSELFAFASTYSGSIAPGGTSQWLPQMAFTTSIADPSVGMPTQNDTDANLWVGPIISNVAPAGAAFSLFGGGQTIFVVPGAGAQEQGYTLGTAFTLSQSCTLNKIWHYSPSGSTALPTRCGIWNATTHTEVAGTDNSSPTWSGAAASGWVSSSYTGVTLPAGNYVASTFLAAETSPWFLAQVGWWGTGAAFPSGITAGPISFTGSQYNLGPTWTYPGTITNEPTGSGEFDGVDVQVTPVSLPPAAPVIAAPGVTGEENRTNPWRKLELLRF